MDRNAQERKSAWKKIDYKTPTLFSLLLLVLLLLHIFLQSLPPSFLHSLPSSPPPAFLSRHASVPANQHRPGQGEGARRERRGGGGLDGWEGGRGANKGALLLPHWGFGEGRHQAGGRRGGAGVEAYRRGESVTEKVYH